MTVKLQVVLCVAASAAILSLLVWQRRVFPPPVERRLEALKVWWLTVAKRIGRAQTAFILFIFYFTVIAIAAVVSRLARSDFLRLRSSAGWHPRPKKRDTIQSLLRQF